MSFCAAERQESGGLEPASEPELGPAPPPHPGNQPLVTFIIAQKNIIYMKQSLIYSYKYEKL